MREIETSTDILAAVGARTITSAQMAIDDAAPAKVAGLRIMRQIFHIPAHPTATAAGLSWPPRRLVGYVHALGDGYPHSLEVWALAQLTAETEVAVVRHARTLERLRLAWLVPGDDPEVALTRSGRAVAAVLAPWRQG